jgi:hypothetical protein
MALGTGGAPAQHRIPSIDGDPIIRGLLSPVLKQRGLLPMTALVGISGRARWGEVARREPLPSSSLSSPTAS